MGHGVCGTCRHAGVYPSGTLAVASGRIQARAGRGICPRCRPVQRTRLAPPGGAGALRPRTGGGPLRSGAPVSARQHDPRRPRRLRGADAADARRRARTARQPRLPAEGRARLPDVAFDAPADVTAVVRIDELPVTGLAMGRAPPDGGASWPKRTSFPDSAQLAAALGRPVEARQLLLDADQPQGYRRDWKPGSAGFGPERHLAYAIQWWGLAALTVVLLVVLNLKRRKP